MCIPPFLKNCGQGKFQKRRAAAAAYSAPPKVPRKQKDAQQKLCVLACHDDPDTIDSGWRQDAGINFDEPKPIFQITANGCEELPKIIRRRLL